MVDFTWVDDFVHDIETENDILKKNGAGHLAEARCAVVEKLRTRVREEQHQLLSVEEAAAMAGVNPETVRRAVRRGELADERTSPKQHIRVRKGDVAYLAARRRKPAPQSNRLASPSEDSYNTDEDLARLRSLKRR